MLASDEMKRRMYSCILLVGGGAKFEGLSTWLHNRLLLQIPYQFRPEQTEIIVGDIGKLNEEIGSSKIGLNTTLLRY